MNEDALIFQETKQKFIVVSGAFTNCTEVKCSSAVLNTEIILSDHHEASQDHEDTMLHLLFVTFRCDCRKVI